MFPRSAINAVPYATLATVAEEVAGGPVDASEIAVGGTPVVNEAGEWVGPTPTVNWSDIEGMPADFADGIDDDTDTDTDSFAELGTSCLDGDIPVWDSISAAWACDMDQDSLADIACTERGTYIGGPMSREDAWYDFATICSGWMLHGHGGWTIEDPASFEVLGFVALGLEPGDHEVELGYLLTKKAEGKGVASETALAVRDWAERELNLTGLVSYIDPDNARSIALATRLGATRDKKAEKQLDDPTTHVYRHPYGKGAT